MQDWIVPITWSLLSSFLIAPVLWIVMNLLSHVCKNSKGIRILKIAGMLVFAVLIFSVLLGQLSTSDGHPGIFFSFDSDILKTFWSLDLREGTITILSSVFLLFWLCGLIFGLLGLGRNIYALGIFKASSVMVTNSEALIALTRISKELGIRRKTRLLLNSSINTPITVGVFKPVIYIPIGLISGMGTDELDMIFRHELAHIKHYDYLINFYLTILEIIFFFNPMVILLVKDVRRELEFVCDDTVLETHNPISYAQTLVKLYEDKSTDTLFLGLIKEQGEFKTRIKRMLLSRNGVFRHSKVALSISLLIPVLFFNLFRMTVPLPDLEIPTSVESSFLSNKPTDIALPNTITTIDKPTKGNRRVAPRDISQYADFMDEINETLIQDGILNGNNRKVVLKFRGSDILNGKELLGDWYGKYIKLFRRHYPPINDKMISTWLFHA